MMLYPSRTLISEPFVSQIETIDKTWIEVQNQPSSYFPRRNNRPVNASNGIPSHQSQQGLLLGHSSNQFNKYSSYYSTQQDYYGNYRSANNNNTGHNFNGVNNFNIGSVAGVKSALPIPKSAVGLVNDRMGNSTAAGMSPVSNVAQIPEVFSDNKVFGKPTTGSSSTGGFMDSKPDSFSAFDPFAGDSSNNFFQLPMFNSSSNILGSNLSSTSSNIWGNNNKTISDAAVWG